MADNAIRVSDNYQPSGTSRAYIKQQPTMTTIPRRITKRMLRRCQESRYRLAHTELVISLYMLPIIPQTRLRFVTPRTGIRHVELRCLKNQSVRLLSVGKSDIIECGGSGTNTASVYGWWSYIRSSSVISVQSVSYEQENLHLAATYCSSTSTLFVPTTILYNTFDDPRALSNTYSLPSSSASPSVSFLTPPRKSSEN